MEDTIQTNFLITGKSERLETFSSAAQIRGWKNGGDKFEWNTRALLFCNELLEYNEYTTYKPGHFYIVDKNNNNLGLSEFDLSEKDEYDEAVKTLKAISLKRV